MQQAAAFLQAAELVSVVRERLVLALENGILYEAPANEALIVLQDQLELAQAEPHTCAALLRIAITALLETPLGAPVGEYESRFFRASRLFQAALAR